MTTTTSISQKQQVMDLLKSIETGDPDPVASIDPDRSTQHNLTAADGLAGFGALMALIPKGSARANPVRVFGDGDHVFSHTDYDFFGPKIGFRHRPLRERADRRALGQPAAAVRGLALRSLELVPARSTSASL